MCHFHGYSEEKAPLLVLVLCLGRAWVSGHAWAVLGLCLGCAWAVPGCAWPVLGLCLGCAWLCLGCAWAVPGLCLAVLGLCLAVPVLRLAVIGLCLAVLGLCLGCAAGLLLQSWAWRRKAGHRGAMCGNGAAGNTETREVALSVFFRFLFFSNGSNAENGRT